MVYIDYLLELQSQFHEMLTKNLRDGPKEHYAIVHHEIALRKKFKGENWNMGKIQGTGGFCNFPLFF